MQRSSRTTMPNCSCILQLPGQFCSRHVWLWQDLWKWNILERYSLCQCFIARSTLFKLINSLQSMCQTLTQNTIYAANGTSFTCQCSTTQFFNGSRCVNKLAINQTCSGDYMCNDYVGLYCNVNKCRCVFMISISIPLNMNNLFALLNFSCPSVAPWNGTYCSVPIIFGYTDPCTFSIECDQSVGLICPTTTGTCDCPEPSNTIFCKCHSYN
jgi:hypothetical protein